MIHVGHKQVEVRTYYTEILPKFYRCTYCGKDVPVGKIFRLVPDGYRVRYACACGNEYCLHRRGVKKIVLQDAKLFTPLKTRIKCSRCRRKTMVLERRAFLAGGGVRGYYACYRCRRVIVLVRSGVTRQISRNRRKLYYI